MSAVPNYAETIFDIATECAMQRRKGRCRVQYGHVYCDDCKFNPKRYKDMHPQDAELFMYRAEREAQATHSRFKTFRPVIGFFFIWNFIFYLLCIWYEHSGRVKAIEEERAKPPPVSAVVTNVYNQIDKTLYTVRDNFKDINGDGKANCQDATLLFYKYYPDKKNMCIEVNRNYETDMHHLFICIKIDGVWRGIEPQAYLYGKRSYWMRDYWGKVYDSQYNRDATAEWRSELAAIGVK